MDDAPIHPLDTRVTVSEPRQNLLHRLPAELVLDIALRASGPSDTYHQWRDWRRSMVRLCRVSWLLRRVLEAKVWETVWFTGSDVALDAGVRSWRPGFDTLGPLPLGQDFEHVRASIKWLKLDGRHFGTRPDVVRDSSSLPMLETLELEKCAGRDPITPHVHLTSLWLDTVFARPDDFARLVSPSITPLLTSLALRSIADPGKVHATEKDRPVVCFPDLPSDLLARLRLLQVDLSDLSSFPPPHLFTRDLPVLLAWHCWHRTPSSLVVPSPAQAPRHVLVGHVAGGLGAHGTWFTNTSGRLIEWVRAAPLLREGHIVAQPPRTLILPSGYERGASDDPVFAKRVEVLLDECDKRGVRVEWATKERWQAEKRLHTVLQRPS